MVEWCVCVVSVFVILCVRCAVRETHHDQEACEICTPGQAAAGAVGSDFGSVDDGNASCVSVVSALGQRLDCGPAGHVQKRGILHARCHKESCCGVRASLRQSQ